MMTDTSWKKGDASRKKTVDVKSDKESVFRMDIVRVPTRYQTLEFLGWDGWSADVLQKADQTSGNPRYSYLSSRCEIECKCVASIWQCGEYDCNESSHQCQVDSQNPDFGYCQERRTGYCRASGDPHIETFDGARYDVMGTCQYYMSVSEYESSIHSPYAVRIKNFKTSPSSPVSMVDRVYFDFKSQNYSTHYTIEIWRNGNALGLFFKFSNSIGQPIEIGQIFGANLKNSLSVFHLRKRS